MLLLCQHISVGNQPQEASCYNSTGQSFTAPPQSSEALKLPASSSSHHSNCPLLVTYPDRVLQTKEPPGSAHLAYVHQPKMLMVQARCIRSIFPSMRSQLPCRTGLSSLFTSSLPEKGTTSHLKPKHFWKHSFLLNSSIKPLPSHFGITQVVPILSRAVAIYFPHPNKRWRKWLLPFLCALKDNFALGKWSIGQTGRANGKYKVCACGQCNGLASGGEREAPSQLLVKFVILYWRVTAHFCI